jgi:hypothetical protein
MSDTPVTLFDRIKSFFARDKNAFWFHHYSSDEKAFERMDAWQLAGVIHEANVRNTVDWATKKIVAEHMLGVRLANIQAKPNYFALVTGLVGAIGGVLLTAALQKPPEQTMCICEYQRSSAAQNSETTRVNPLTPVAQGQSAVGAPEDIKKSATKKNKP